jgi:feruloyl esterase
MRRRWFLAGLVAAGWSVPAAAQDCAGLRGSYPGAVVVTAATAVGADATRPFQPDTPGGYKPVPVGVPLCRVSGTIEGNIGFELWLPLAGAWNGRLLGAGVGGDAGVFNYSDLSRRVSEGFAAVTTDSGHKSSQPHWMTDAKVRTNYEHRATHLATQAAKVLVARFYMRPATHSYFLGCSGGGRQGLKELEEYPADYDGIVAGAPGPYMPLISVRMMWSALLQKQSPAAALSDADWSLYEKATFAACDAKDGVRDSVVENPLTCAFKPAALACKPGQTSGCLSAPKVKMLATITGAMPDEQGRPMDRGLLPGVRTRPGPPSPLLRQMWADAVHNNPDWDETTFRRTADLAAANTAMPQLRADRTDIAPFLARGGKAIVYQGWQDPSVIAGPTIDFYRRLAAAQGGMAALGRSVRLMMVPGMYHCQGGPGVDQFGGAGQATTPGDPQRDILWSVIDWVEHGRAPDTLIGTRLVAGAPVFTRKLCAFPQSARYTGGDQADARFYRCAVDPVLAAYR